jgi:hypothetical protein
MGGDLPCSCATWDVSVRKQAVSGAYGERAFHYDDVSQQVHCLKPKLARRKSLALSQASPTLTWINGPKFGAGLNSWLDHRRRRKIGSEQTLRRDFCWSNRRGPLRQSIDANQGQVSEMWFLAHAQSRFHFISAARRTIGPIENVV